MLSTNISIIVPCYKQAKYLDECLQSVFDQIFTDWECIIVNDGSPDDTEFIAKKWIEKDSRFKYFYKENGGLSSARNFGIESAVGEWILPLDADDYISDDYLQLAKSHFKNNNLKVIYCLARKFGLQTEILKLEKFSLKQLALENVIFCTAFYKKSDWQKAEGYDENLKSGYEDWEFWINILKESGEVLKLEKVCFFYRIKEDSMLINLKKINDESTIQYIENKHRLFFEKNLGSIRNLYRENEQNKKVLDAINKRFFSRVVNKLYSIKENFFNRF
ncbi:glycosyltransferase family 2 protein [Halpernia frigidisoli]|uniref:Glycosyl transferase family 2 n=1 Tax=Halpernia frigidisoli TaxID=1125876 RepID=A0A1I3FES1_9FLAO|nr:glycosyltransferase family A protein [Halpernia frigidisoli]SFI09718.1 Glycosyl transferase family 2 [Halpernia frigidisoli]